MSTLTRFDPFPDFAELRRRFERVFDDLGDGGERGWTPAIDVIENEKEIKLRADLPGIKPDEVKIELEDGMLTVTGEHEESTEEKAEHFLRRERHYGAFSRSLRVPSSVKADDIEASYGDGVLEIKVPVPKRKAQAVKVASKGA